MPAVLFISTASRYCARCRPENPCPWALKKWETKACCQGFSWPACFHVSCNSRFQGSYSHPLKQALQWQGCRTCLGCFREAVKNSLARRPQQLEGESPQSRRTAPPDAWAGIFQAREITLRHFPRMNARCQMLPTEGCKGCHGLHCHIGSSPNPWVDCYTQMSTHKFHVGWEALYYR